MAINSVLNVRWFGAKGDGVTDDTVAIQAALDAAVAQLHSVVFFPRGDYSVSNLVVNGNAITLEGESLTDISIIRGRAGSTGYLITDSGNASKICMRQLQVTGNNVVGYTSLIRFGHNTSPFGTEGELVSVWARDAVNAIAFDIDANVGRIHRCSVFNVKSGLVLTGDVNKVIDFTCASFTEYGIRLVGTSNTLVGIELESPTAAAVPLRIEGGYNKVFGIVFALTPAVNTTDLISSTTAPLIVLGASKANTGTFTNFMTHVAVAYVGATARNFNYSDTWENLTIESTIPTLKFVDGTTVGFVGNADNLVSGTAGRLAIRADTGLYLSGMGNNPNQLFLASGGGIGIGSATVDASSVLDINSTTKGFKLPRMTKAQRDAIASPSNGLLIYQNDGTIGPKAYVNGAWNTLNITADP